MDMPNGPVHKPGTRRRHEPNNRERSLELPKQVLVNLTNDSDAGTIRNLLANARSEIQRFTDLMSDYVDFADRRVKNLQEPPAGAFPGGTTDEKIQYYESRRQMCAHAYEMSLKSRKRDENAKNLQIFPDDGFRKRYFLRKEMRMEMKREAEEEFAQPCEYIVEIRQRKFNRANSVADVQEVGHSRSNEESHALLTRRQLVESEDRNRVMDHHSAGDGATNQQHQGDVMARRDETTTPAIDGDNATVGSNQQEGTTSQPRRHRWRIRVPWLRRIWRWARKHRQRNSRTIPDAATDNQ
ncbi:uncharacterized protein [Antedon mediterranea]|uniref:uncharacterized protein n=1 Tax=Antedon mediterranea TaxID=105859 RepID=UPI003AF5F20C